MFKIDRMHMKGLNGLHVIYKDVSKQIELV